MRAAYGKRYTPEPKLLSYPTSLWQRAVELYSDGLSCRIAQHPEGNYQTVMYGRGRLPLSKRSVCASLRADLGTRISAGNAELRRSQDRTGAL
jgi:hypothetical protein